MSRPRTPPATLGPEHLASLAAARQADVLRREVLEAKSEYNALLSIAQDLHAEIERLRLSPAMGPIMEAANSLSEVDVRIVLHLFDHAHDRKVRLGKWPLIELELGMACGVRKDASRRLRGGSNPLIASKRGRGNGVYLTAFGVRVAEELSHRRQIAAPGRQIRAHRA